MPRVSEIRATSLTLIRRRSPRSTAETRDWVRSSNAPNCSCERPVCSRTAANTTPKSWLANAFRIAGSSKKPAGSNFLNPAARAQDAQMLPVSTTGNAALHARQMRPPTPMCPLQPDQPLLSSAYAPKPSHVLKLSILGPEAFVFAGRQAPLGLALLGVGIASLRTESGASTPSAGAPIPLSRIRGS